MAFTLDPPSLPFGSLQFSLLDAANRSSPLLHLPFDLLHCILSRLPAKDLCQVAACCRSLSRHAYDEDLWGPLFDGKWGTFFHGKSVFYPAEQKINSLNRLALPESLQQQLDAICSCQSSFEDQSEQVLTMSDSSPVMTPVTTLPPGQDVALRASGPNLNQGPIRNRPVSSTSAWPNPSLDCPIHSRPSSSPCGSDSLSPGTESCTQSSSGAIPNQALGSEARPLSYMHLYSLLESGHLDFPVQIFNCEQYLGCLLSAYDARARYTGRRKKVSESESDGSTNFCEVWYAGPVYHEILEAPLLLHETDVEWGRLRPAPCAGAPAELYPGNDILRLTVGDFVEVQWRVHEDMPYTWFFGQVRHYLFCQKACAFDAPIPPCPDCVCNQLGRVCITFRKFGFEYVERSLFLDKELPADFRMAQGVGFGVGTFGGVRVVSDPRQLAAWMEYGRQQWELLGSP